MSLIMSIYRPVALSPWQQNINLSLLARLDDNALAMMVTILISSGPTDFETGV